MNRSSKLVALEHAVEWIESGMHVAFGGFLIHNKPSALIRELARRGADELVISSCPTASYDVDILIGLGLVRETILGNVSFDYLGKAPRFTAAAESGSIVVTECDEVTVAGGYMATIEGLPFHPVHTARVHDVAKRSRLVTEYVAHTGDHLAAVEALAPDVAVLHVQQADPHGNGRHLGSIWGDGLIAKASKRVILLADEVISEEETRSAPRLTTIPGYLVDAVVEIPYGAHPCSSHGRYLYDPDHLGEYISSASSAVGFASYVERFVIEPGSSHDVYLERIGGHERLHQLEWRMPWDSTTHRTS